MIATILVGHPVRRAHMKSYSLLWSSVFVERQKPDSHGLRKGYCEEKSVNKGSTVAFYGKYKIS